MDNNNTTRKIGLLIILYIGIASIFFFILNKRDKHTPVITINKENYTNQTHTIDSLTRVVDSLQTEIFSIEDGFDYKEHRYEDVVFEYELGLSYLKDYHPKAYKDFHRIIAHKERYSHEVERENTKILNQYKTE
jgi:uncharacterized protein YpmS